MNWPQITSAASFVFGPLLGSTIATPAISIAPSPPIISAAASATRATSAGPSLIFFAGLFGRPTFEDRLA